MRAVIQRVSAASVTTDRPGKIFHRHSTRLLILLGIEPAAQ
jgi:D-Tyr-tRNAtyr deacylase